MILPRPTVRITHAAKLEFSSRDRSENREAGQAVGRGNQWHVGQQAKGLGSSTLAAVNRSTSRECGRGMAPDRRGNKSSSNLTSFHASGNSFVSSFAKSSRRSNSPLTA